MERINQFATNLDLKLVEEVNDHTSINFYLTINESQNFKIFWLILNKF